MAAIAAVILQALSCLETSTCDCLDRHRKLDEELESLKERRDELNAKRADIITDHLDHPALVSQPVENWLRKVQKIIDEVTKLEKRRDQVSYLSRCCLGIGVRSMITKVNETHQQTLPEYQATIRATSSTTNPEVDDTVKREILNYLTTNNGFGMIGVYGNGVGKTIMKNIYTELVKHFRFERVIWVTVQHPFTVKLLQQRINSQMGGGFRANEGEKQVQASSLMGMMGGVKYALILDNVLGSFNLDLVGVPKPTENNECKVVIISRSLDVCLHLGCKVFHAERVSKHNSLDLFLDKVGLDKSRISRDLGGILDHMVRMCAGSRLAVIVIAASLKGVTDIEDWKRASNELLAKTTQEDHTTGGSHEQILDILEFSYDRLEDSKTKSCLLSCSLYPEDCEIHKNDLIEYWMDMGLLPELETRQDMCGAGHGILETLINNCLLETQHRAPGFVKMLGPIRNMALRIKRSDRRLMVEAGLQLMEMPKAEKWTNDLEEVSLMNNIISEISPNMSPPCPILSTLLLQDNSSLKQIPENFFENMPCLKFLDLSRTVIESLPASICRLKKLTSLLLHGCDHLKNIPSLENLTALKKLDLWGARIEEVPEGIEKLTNLQYLDLYCPYLSVLKTEIFNDLSCLQHLVVYWRLECLKISEGVVAKLEKLESFEGQLYNLRDFNNYVKSSAFQRLSKYMLAVGPDLRCWKFVEDHSKRVSLSRCEIGEDNSVELPDDLQELSIRECNNVRSLTDGSISLENKNCLRSCGIEKCEGITDVVDMVTSSSSFINNLEDLRLSALNNLLVLVNVEEAKAAPTLPNIFSYLKTFEIMRCPKMKMLFPFELLQGLKNLHYIRVEECCEMKEIIGSQVDKKQTRSQVDKKQTSDAAARFTTLELSELHLMELPKLEKICPGGGEMVCHSLKSITIEKCPKLERFPIFVPGNGQPISSNHADFKICLDSKKLLESMKRDNPNSEDHLLPRVELRVDHEWRPLSGLPEDFFQPNQSHAIGGHDPY